jgi:hypothetical protein
MQTMPFFKDATPAVNRVMRFFVGANIVVIAFCALYLVRHFGAARLGWPGILATALAGYFLADFSSGMIHWGMDTWFDERTLGRAIAISREHHTHPHRIHGYSFLDYASLGSTPSAVVFGFAVLLTMLFPVAPATYVLMIVREFHLHAVRNKLSQSGAPVRPLGHHAARPAAPSGLPAGPSLGPPPPADDPLLCGERMGELSVRRVLCLARA